MCSYTKINSQKLQLKTANTRCFLYTKEKELVKVTDENPQSIGVYTEQKNSPNVL